MLAPNPKGAKRPTGQEAGAKFSRQCHLRRKKVSLFELLLLDIRERDSKLT